MVPLPLQGRFGRRSRPQTPLSAASGGRKSAARVKGKIMKNREYNITPYERGLIPASHQLRREMTKQERKLWHGFLKNYPVRIYRQRVIDRFIVDFYCSQAKLVIELDGGQHLSGEGLARDNERSEVLNAYGIRVLRFTNEQIEHDYGEGCKTIDLAVKERTRPDPHAPDAAAGGV